MKGRRAAGPFTAAPARRGEAPPSSWRRRLVTATMTTCVERANVGRVEKGSKAFRRSCPPPTRRFTLTRLECP
ncbi:Hypothetical protein NTJ_08232 [Nesidiocoris tenuis]|nr:Hypothetical protein NTJ_08232 [Nesidiocoris tenuis]